MTAPIIATRPVAGHRGCRDASLKRLRLPVRKDDPLYSNVCATIPSMSDPLALFSLSVSGWFSGTFGAPTRPQELGWPAIARGEHVLIVSPTGSGKTLTAFLWSIDNLFRELSETPEPEKSARAKNGYQPGIRVVYVSPLKALNNDVERNL